MKVSETTKVSTDLKTILSIVVGVAQDKRPEGRHWDNLKIKYLKDNPDIIIMEQAIPNEIK